METAREHAGETPRRRRIRIPVVLASNVLVLAFIFSCCNPPPPAANASLTICALDAARAADFPADACQSGALHATGSTQDFRITAVGTDGKPEANAHLTITVKGTNSQSASATTDADGQATFQYAGAAQGTDTISVAVEGGTSKLQRPAVIHWLTPHSGAAHPLILVHGIQEDATDFAHQFDPSISDFDQATDASEQTWTPLIEGLTTLYDRRHLKAFCYVDDVAWVHSAGVCPAGSSQQCDPNVARDQPNACISQSAITPNGVALAHVVQQLSASAGNKPVTLVAYSMGGAVVRNLLAGCLTAPRGAPNPDCASADALVDNVFFLDGAQQGSWLLLVKAGADAATVAGANIPALADSPFLSVLPVIEPRIYGFVNQKLGLNLNGGAEQDLTPQSANYVNQNSVLPASNAQLYTFHGDVEVGINVRLLSYTVPASSYLPMGDLVMLAQNDDPLATPLWGGGTLCGGCGNLPDSGFHANGNFHAWVMTQRYAINMDGLVPLLSISDIGSSLDSVINSPVTHLNVTQPVTLAPGTAIQIHDATGLAGSETTDIPYEILLVLMHEDHFI